MIGNAQSFTVTPGTTANTTVSVDSSVDVYINFNNVFQQPITLIWEETNRSYPSQWIMTICDNALCYSIPHLRDTMNPINVGAHGYLKVTCTPAGTPGTGVVAYHVWDMGNPLYQADVTYNFNGLTAVTPSQPSDLYTVTPVPANNFVELAAKYGPLIKGNARVYDLQGKLLIEQPVNAVQSTRVDVSGLLDGIYMLRYESKAGLLTKKIVVTH